MFNFIKKQFIDIIQWENPDEETLVWRFPIADQEIQNGASLTVREAQMAIVCWTKAEPPTYSPPAATRSTHKTPPS